MKLAILFLFIGNFIFCTSVHPRSVTINKPLKLSDEVRFEKLITTGFQYSVSSCISGEYCGDALFDSNSNTWWATENSTSEEWVQIDFGTKRLINGIEIEVINFSDVAEYQVQALIRGTWTAIFKGQFRFKSEKRSIGNIDASVLKIIFIKKEKASLSINNLKLLLNDVIITGISKRFTGFLYPVENGVLPSDDYSLPGAPRKYRNGIHKGVDISQRLDNSGNPQKLTRDTPILACTDGVVVRADLKYIPMTEQDFQETTEYNQKNGVTFVDKDFGGRQVWIDHGNGIMTSYNHLSYIPEIIKEGARVKKGDVIGGVGNSGLMGEAKKNDEGIHLHLEIWIDGEFAGKDMNPKQSRKFLEMFFSE